MKIVFMGTPEFAVPSLSKLINKHEVLAVFTQPDRPKGRGKKLSISPVKEEALKYDIDVYQPIKIKNDIESINIIKSLQPDLIVVVAFGQILPKDVLDVPRYGCINLHASLLPKYRGAAPINWVIINGEKTTGNTTMLMDVGLDTGDMLLNTEFEVTDNMTAGELHNILMDNGAELLIETIDKLVLGQIEPRKQNNEDSSYAPMLTKELGEINWSFKSKQIKNLIRGLNPWPVAYTKYMGENMKIYEADVIDVKNTYEPGYIIEVSKRGIEVASGDGILLIKKIQFSGGKPLNVEEYIKGHTIRKGIKLG